MDPLTFRVVLTPLSAPASPRGRHRLHGGPWSPTRGLCSDGTGKYCTAGGAAGGPRVDSGDKDDDDGFEFRTTWSFQESSDGGRQRQTARGRETGEFPAMSPADELFYQGRLLPLKLPPRLLYERSYRCHCAPAARDASPTAVLKGFDPFAAALERIRKEEGGVDGCDRDVGRSRRRHRTARSLEDKGGFRWAGGGHRRASSAPNAPGEGAGAAAGDAHRKKKCDAHKSKSRSGRRLLFPWSSSPSRGSTPVADDGYPGRQKAGGPELQVVKASRRRSPGRFGFRPARLAVQVTRKASAASAQRLLGSCLGFGAGASG